MAVDKSLLDYAVDYAVSRGASYAEARYHLRRILSISTRSDRLLAAGREISEGIAIRVLYKGVLSFASTSTLTREGVTEAVERALAQARAGTRGGVEHRMSSEERLGYARFEAPMRKTFDSMSIEDKIALAKELWKRSNSVLREAKLATFSVSYTEWDEEKEIVTSDGGWVYSRIPRLALFIMVTLAHPQKGTMQRAIDYGGSGGLEWLDEWNPLDEVPEELQRIERVLLEGVEPPRDPVPVIVGSEVVGLIVHESAGHPMEADRIWAREAAQAGESYVKAEMLGKERIGNEHATVVDDPTIPRSFGFYLYDDETVPARPRYLYLKGLINEPLHNRWSAAIYGTSSNAAARAMDYESEPIVRMANTYLTPGDHRFEELLEEARDGVYIKSYMEWNIDDVRWGQRYVGLESYMIRNGDLAEPVRNPVLELTTKAFYSSIEAKSRELQFYPGMCGKGEPPQGVPVWFGGPDVLLKPLRLGIAPS